MKKYYLTLLVTLILLISGGFYLKSQFQIFYPAQLWFSGKYLAHASPSNGERSFSTVIKIAPVSLSKFKILVWNLHKGQDQGWQKTLTELSNQANLVLLQETTPELEQQAKLIEDFPYRLYGNSFAYKGNSTGVGILSQINPEQFYVTSQIEPLLRLPKVALLMKFKLKVGSEFKELLVVNMHLVNFDPTIKSYREQLNQMGKLIAKYQGAVVLAGDFNAWNNNRIATLQKFTQSLGLHQVKFTPDERVKFMGKPLDFIFVRDLKVNYATSMQTSSSDHNPLLVELSFE